MKVILHTHHGSTAIELGYIDTRFLQPILDTITVIPVISWTGDSDGNYGGGPAELLIAPTGRVVLFPLYVDKNGYMSSKYNQIRIYPTSQTFPLLYN